MASQTAMREEIDQLQSNMNSLLELNQQMIGSILQLRVSQNHGQDNPIVIDDESSFENGLVNTAPIPEEHWLVLINELAESESSGDDKDEIWEISHEEFIGSSSEL